MKLAQKLILAAGLLTLLVLLVKMDVSAVARLVVQVRWGFALILVQEIAAHAFNAAGWRLSYREEDARAFGWRELFTLRVAGDGVNYLTPTATIAGEFARAALLNGSRPASVRTAGVVVAKCAQALGQLLFVLFGLALFARGKTPWLRPYEAWIRTAALAVAALLAGGLALLLARREASLEEGEIARRYFLVHPLRAAASVLFFLLGFAWGGFEAYWICRFLGVGVSAGTAMAIEALSCLIDGLTIMVPAKAGTQEAGKTAIFSLLGLPARSGLAFGIVRHLRELAWAVLGLAVYSRRLGGRTA